MLTTEEQLDRVRQILLHNDRVEIADLRDMMTDRDRLAERVAPIFEERIEYLKKEFPTEFGVMIDAAVESKLERSQDALLAILYPILGKMIRKFVQQQIEELRDSIDKQQKQLLSAQNWRKKLTALLTGGRESDAVLTNVNLTRLERFYVIQHNTGLLIGSYSIDENTDEDIIAGMLTAIKAFAEDAFKTGQDLEEIQYGSFRILIYNFYKYYIAVAVSGVLSDNDEEQLADQINEFNETYLQKAPLNQINSGLQRQTSLKLQAYFKNYIQ
jgi:uncharacterized protein YgbK (DUF1537 family)